MKTVAQVIVLKEPLSWFRLALVLLCVVGVIILTYGDSAAEEDGDGGSYGGSGNDDRAARGTVNKAGANLTADCRAGTSCVCDVGCTMTAMAQVPLGREICCC